MASIQAGSPGIKWEAAQNTPAVVPPVMKPTKGQYSNVSQKYFLSKVMTRHKGRRVNVMSAAKNPLIVSYLEIFGDSRFLE